MQTTLIILLAETRIKTINDMKQEMVITPVRQAVELKSVSYRVAMFIRKPLLWLSHYYSMVMERSISIRQTLALLHVQIAFVFAVFPVGGSLLLRAACAAWLWYAVKHCRRQLTD